MARPKKTASQATTTASPTQVRPSQATTTAFVTQGRASQATTTDSPTQLRASQGRSTAAAVQVRATQLKGQVASSKRKSKQPTASTAKQQKRPFIEDDGSSDELSTDKEILADKKRTKRPRLTVPDTLLHDAPLDSDQSENSGSEFQPEGQKSHEEPNSSLLNAKGLLQYDNSTPAPVEQPRDPAIEQSAELENDGQDRHDRQEELGNAGDEDSDSDGSGRNSTTCVNAIFKTMENGHTGQTPKPSSKRQRRSASELLLNQLDDDERDKLEVLVEIARIHYLRYFDLEHDVLLTEVFGRRWRVSSPVIKMAKQRITANQANWKFVMKEKMQERVLEIIKHDETHEIVDCPDFGQLTELFGHHYSTSACESVFDFATRLVNVEQTTRQHESHFLFLRQMWSTLAAKVKLNLMWQEDENALAQDEDSDQCLAKWIPLMATSTEWADIEPSHFVRMPHKKKRQKRKLNVRAPDSDPSYVFLGAKFVGRNERAGEDVGRGVHTSTNTSSATMNPT